MRSWIRRRSADREQLGATLQVLTRASSSATVRLRNGPPLTNEVLFAWGRKCPCGTAVVVEHTRALMQQQLSPRGGFSQSAFDHISDQQ